MIFTITAGVFLGCLAYNLTRCAIRSWVDGKTDIPGRFWKRLITKL